MVNRISVFSVKHKEMQERHLFVSFGQFKSDEEFWECFASQADVDEYDKRTLRWHEDTWLNGNTGMFSVALPNEFD
jgi:hypothetical protein